MEHFDLVVIGSGPAGFSAAMRGLDFGKNVCIIEKNQIGGAGIMNGALTSKTMWELSHDFAVANSVDRGYRASSLIVDYKKVRKTVLQAAKDKQYQILSQIETFSRQRSENGSLTLKYGSAKFNDRSSILIDNDGVLELISGSDFVIATGSRPRTYTGIEVDQKRIVDSDGILNLTEFPERLLIIGSGIIGCEFATIFSNFRQTQVHILDRQHRVIPMEDDDVIEFVSKNLEDNGVTIHHTANLRAIKEEEDFIQVVLDYEDGHSKVIEVDVILIAIGRIPNIENLGLENVGIVPNSKGYLDINDYCMLSDNPKNAHFFAAGDVTGHAQLYNVAEHQGRSAIESIYASTAYESHYRSMATLMFFKPELAAVGQNEKSLQKKGIAYKSVYYTSDLVNRSIAMRNTRGFVKIMISDDEKEQILGMRAGGPQASAYITSVSQLIEQGARLKDITGVVHPHPSVTEAIQDCLRVFHNSSIHKPLAFPNFIKMTKWKPADPMME